MPTTAEPDVVRPRLVERADVGEHEGRLDDEDDAEGNGQERQPRELGFAAG